MDWKHLPTTCGQGAGTPRKQEGLRTALAVSLDISRGGGAGKYPYWHLDCNAGPGYLHRIDCEGSPLVFLREARQNGRRYHAHFCDSDRHSVESLNLHLSRQYIPRGCSVSAHHMDNDTFLRHMAWYIRAVGGEKPQYAVGTVYCDPNGVQFGFPRRALVRFAREYPRIDIVLSLNLHHYRMGLGAVAKGKKGFTSFRWPNLLARARMFNRKYWLVRNLPADAEAGDSMTFTLLVGRNVIHGYKQYRDFYPLYHPAARHVLEHLRRWDDGQARLPFGA